MSNKIDVFIPTLNASKTIEATLISVREAGIPVNNILLVDGFSGDDTIDRARNFCESNNWGFNYALDRGGLGEARFIGNAFVETPIYLSIDSDVLLPRGWFNAIYPDLLNDPSLIYSGSYVVFGDEGSIVRDAFEFYNKERNTTPVLCATLIRKSLAKFDIMRGIHVGEDTIYNFDVIEKGGRFKIHHDINAYHPSTLTRDLKHAYGWGGGARAIGRHWAVEVIRILRAGGIGVKASLKGGDPLLAVYLPLREIVHLAGFLRGRRIARAHSFREELDLIFANRRMVRGKNKQANDQARISVKVHNVEINQPLRVSKSEISGSKDKRPNED